ncbi:hypothetical protein A4G20_05295 [Pasteurellaceae bacterium RH1A]|nr:hypothetical protein A4G20_05295 [Pasteurellaceae bacterium RH1A]
MKSYFLAIFLLFSTACWAETVDTYTFQNEADRSRAVALAKTLRCVQCQNQNLVESNSQAAFQLRTEVYQMVEAGKSNEQIKAELVERFGDFVLYQPPVNWRTYVLWGLPPLLLVLAFGFAWLYLKGRKGGETSQQAVENEENFAKNPQHSTAYRLPSWLIWGLVLAFPLAYYAYTGRYQAINQGQNEFKEAMAIRQEQSHEARKESLVEAIQNRLRQDPNKGQDWFELGQAYMQANEFDNALEAYSRASILLGRKPMILGAGATALYYQSHKKMTPDVRAWIEEALAGDPNESASLALLASEAFAKQDYDLALKYWQQILDSGRTDIERRAIIRAMENAERLKGRGK